MNKKDLLDNINKIYSKLEDAFQSIQSLESEVKDAIRLIEELPSEPDEIEDSEKDGES